MNESRQALTLPNFDMKTASHSYFHIKTLFIAIFQRQKKNVKCEQKSKYHTQHDVKIETTSIIFV